MLGVIKARACKKCGGDLSLECDIYGVYIQCIQCGANWNEKDINLKPKDLEIILKAVKVRRQAAVNTAQETNATVAVKRVVVPYPEKSGLQLEKPDKQVSSATNKRT